MRQYIKRRTCRTVVEVAGNGFPLCPLKFRAGSHLSFSFRKWSESANELYFGTYIFHYILSGYPIPILYGIFYFFPHFSDIPTNYKFIIQQISSEICFHTSHTPVSHARYFIDFWLVEAGNNGSPVVHALKLRPPDSLGVTAVVLLPYALWPRGASTKAYFSRQVLHRGAGQHIIFRRLNRSIHRAKLTSLQEDKKSSFRLPRTTKALCYGFDD